MKDIFGYCQSLLYQFLCLHSQSHNDDLSELLSRWGAHNKKLCLIETEHKFKNGKARLAIILMFTEIYLKGSLNHATANLHSVLGGLKYGAKWFLKKSLR